MAIVKVNLGRIVPTPTGLVSQQYPDGNDGTTAPSTPQLNQPFAAGTTQIDLTLLTYSTGGTAPLTYYIERSTTSEFTGFTALTNGQSLFASGGKYSDTTVSASTSYWYRVRTADAAGTPRQSAWSEVVTVTTPAVTGDTTKPSIPGNATYVEVNSTVLQVFSTGSTDNVAVQDYDVLMGRGNGVGVPVDAGTIVQTITAFPAVLQNLDPSQEYYVRLRARDTSGNVSTDFSTATFHTMAATPPARAGILHTIDFSSFGTNKFNPPQSAFPAIGIDANDNKHIGQTGESFSTAALGAGYQALPHLEILSSWTDTTPLGPVTITPPNGGRAARCTLYYLPVDYTVGGYQSIDKPRIDFHVDTLKKFSPPATMPRDAEYWLGLQTWIPTNYVEDTSASKEFLLQMHPTTPQSANNSFSFYIKGGAGGNASWVLEAKNYGNVTAGDNDPDSTGSGTAFTLTTPLTQTHKGNFVYHVFHWKININDASQNYFHYYLTQDPSVGQVAIHKSNTATRFGVQSNDFFEPAGNYYKGSWRNDGTYDGNKTGSSILVWGEYRIGSSSSNYQSVHPTRQAQP